MYRTDVSSHVADNKQDNQNRDWDIEKASEIEHSEKERQRIGEAADFRL